MTELSNPARAPRVITHHQAILVDSAGCQANAVVTDISSGGFRLTTCAKLRIGEVVHLCVGRDEEFAVQILWIRDEEAGGAFLEKVNLG